MSAPFVIHTDGSVTLRTNLGTVYLKEGEPGQCPTCGYWVTTHVCSGQPVLDRADVALVVNYFAASWMTPEVKDAYKRLVEATS